MSSILFLLLLFFTDWWTFVVFQPSPTPTTVAHHRFFSNRKPRLYPVYRQLLCLKPRRIPLLSPEVAFVVTIVQIVGGLSNSRHVKVMPMEIVGGLSQWYIPEIWIICIYLPFVVQVPPYQCSRWAMRVHTLCPRWQQVSKRVAPFYVNSHLPACPPNPPSWPCPFTVPYPRLWADTYRGRL